MASNIVDDILLTPMPRRRRIQPQAARPIGDLLSMVPPEDRYRDFEEEIEAAQTKFRDEHPYGLRRDELNFSLETPDDIYRVCAEKLSPLANYFVQCYGRSSEEPAIIVDGAVNLDAYAKWLEKNAYNLNLYELKRLSIAEIARMYHGQGISGSLSKTIWQHPIHTYVSKLALSAWHWYTPYDSADRKLPWQKVVQFHKMIMDFDFGVPDFEVTIDHSRSWMNRRGYGVYAGKKNISETGECEECWIDGEFAFIVCNRGEHLMTIGLSTTNAGVLLNQIQLQRPKGNRWLYKLGVPYFQYVVNRLYAACSAAGLDLFMPTGKTMRAYIETIHNKNLPWSDEEGKRIERVYNQRLHGFRRSAVKFTCEKFNYRQITPRK
jgi:hypothetical protein